MQNVEPKKEISFKIRSEDEISLLYDFLEELLFYHEIEFMLFSEFHVGIDDMLQLRATIRGEAIDWDRHERKTEIKAITYHKMDVRKTDIFEVQAIVDL